MNACRSPDLMKYAALRDVSIRPRCPMHFINCSAVKCTFVLKKTGSTMLTFLNQHVVTATRVDVWYIYINVNACWAYPQRAAGKSMRAMSLGYTGESVKEQRPLVSHSITVIHNVYGSIRLLGSAMVYTVWR